MAARPGKRREDAVYVTDNLPEFLGGQAKPAILSTGRTGNLCGRHRDG